MRTTRKRATDEQRILDAARAIEGKRPGGTAATAKIFEILLAMEISSKKI